MITSMKSERLQENCNNYAAETNLQFVHINDVPDNLISLREVCRASFNLRGQGYDWCNCTQL
jgi:hypothetical protein